MEVRHGPVRRRSPRTPRPHRAPPSETAETSPRRQRLPRHRRPRLHPLRDRRSEPGSHSLKGFGGSLRASLCFMIWCCHAMVRKRKIIIYIATSADGFIARPDGSFDWLDGPRPRNYGMGAFYKSIDTILWGRKTCDLAFDFQKRGVAGTAFDTKVNNYVFTRHPQSATPAGVEFVNEHPSAQEKGKRHLDDGRRRHHCLLSRRRRDRRVHDPRDSQTYRRRYSIDRARPAHRAAQTDLLHEVHRRRGQVALCRASVIFTPPVSAAKRPIFPSPELRWNIHLAHPLLPPHPRQNQPNLVISNLRRQSVLQRLQPVDPNLGASRLNHSLLVPINPSRLKLQISFLDQVGHSIHHSGELPSADFRNVLEAVARNQQTHRLQRGRSLLFGRRDGGAASPAAVALESGEYSLPIHFRFPLADSSNAQQIANRRRAQAANLLQRRVMQHHKCRDALLLRRNPPPLP